MRSKRESIVTPLHSDKNIAEPVTSQGVFGPNGMSRPGHYRESLHSPITGQLVCFSRAPPRIVRNPLHELTTSPSTSHPTDSIPRLFQSPALIADAVKRLALASRDSRKSNGAQRREDGDNILHIMTTSWDRYIHPMHSVRSIDSFSDSINLFCLWHPPRNAQMFCMPPSRQRRVVSSHVLHYPPF
jgi:hypothetical protein